MNLTAYRVDCNRIDFPFAIDFRFHDVMHSKLVSVGGFLQCAEFDRN